MFHRTLNSIGCENNIRPKTFSRFHFYYPGHKSKNGTIKTSTLCLSLRQSQLLFSKTIEHRKFKVIKLIKGVLNGLIHDLNSSSVVKSFYQIVTHFNLLNKNISHEVMK